MAKTHTGLIYPRARGKECQTLNVVVDDLVEAIVQCWFCDKDKPFPKGERERHAYVWKAVKQYATNVVKYHKY